MNSVFSIAFVLFFIVGCTNERLTLPGYHESVFTKVEEKFAIPNEEYDTILRLFISNCNVKYSKKLYKELCEEARSVTDAKAFFTRRFDVYSIASASGDVGLLTGYFEPTLEGALHQDRRFRYPVYGVPKDLVVVDLGEVYPQLRKFRLRGRIEGNRLVPYYKRGERKRPDAPVLCYVDDDVELFFLEIQGSGRIRLRDGTIMYVAYADQNGHPYRSIGKYMIEQGYLTRENVSMETIATYLRNHPEQKASIFRVNPSQVFFQKATTPAKGAAGIVLEPMRSIAVDATRIPLGGMYYYKTLDDTHLEGVVFAQDVGGAIRGSVRADLFCGNDEKAKSLASSLRAPLKLWIFLPKKSSR